jgi:hypothetical protein
MIFQLSQARPVEMIHMRMREQDKIWNPNLRKVDRRVNQTLHANGKGPDPDPDPRAKNRVCQDAESVHANQYCTVADPRCLQSFPGPL